MRKMNVLSKMTLFFFGILLSASSAFSQGKLSIEALTSEWSLFHEANGIKFYIKKDVYSQPGRLDLDYALFKLENTSDKKWDVSYKPVVYYAEECKNCNSDEYFKTVSIPAHSSVEGTLADSKLPIVMLLANPNLKGGLTPKSIGIERLIIN